MRPNEAETAALQRHPDCKFARAEPGLDWSFNLTWSVNLWRNEECYAASDPPRHVVEGFYQKEATMLSEDGE